MSAIDDAVKAAWEAIDAEADFTVELTREMVRIPTVNPKFQLDPEINREPEHQDLMEKVLKDEGFETERWDVFEGRPNVLGDKAGSEEKSLILCGHVDVVPVGDPSAWKRPPFSAEVDGGFIWGRGAVDMKGGVAACIAAARALRLAGIELDGRLSIHTVVDEEAGGFGAMDAVKRGKLAKNAIIAEPSWGDVMPAEGGLTWARVTLIGKQAHAGMRYNTIYPQAHLPGRIEPGVNAIELGQRFLAALRDFEMNRCRNNWHPLCPPGLATINPGVILGGAGLQADGTPQILANPAIIPDVCAIDLDYKFMPNENFEDVKKEFEDFVHHWAQTDPWTRAHPPRIEWDLYDLNFPPMNTPTDHPLVTSLVDRAEAAQGWRPTVKGFDAVTDAAHYAGAGVSPAIYGPAGDGFHGYDECVSLDSLKATTKVLAAAAIDCCGLK